MYHNENVRMLICTCICFCLMALAEKRATEQNYLCKHSHHAPSYYIIYLHNVINKSDRCRASLLHLEFNKFLNVWYCWCIF